PDLQDRIVRDGFWTERVLDALPAQVGRVAHFEDHVARSGLATAREGDDRGALSAHVGSRVAQLGDHVDRDGPPADRVVDRARARATRYPNCPDSNPSIHSRPSFE